MEKQKQVIDLKHFVTELKKMYVAQGGDLEASEKETLRLKEEVK
ncbi:hypothetical protein [Psychrobacillus sp. L3]